MSEADVAPGQDIVFGDSQIGKGLVPLAQHGSVVVGGDGMLTLLGTKGDVLDSAPLSDVTAKRLLITGGQTVILRWTDRKYNVSPGYGLGAGGVFRVAKAAKHLVKLVAANGR